MATDDMRYGDVFDVEDKDAEEIAEEADDESLLFGTLKDD